MGEPTFPPASSSYAALLRGARRLRGSLQKRLWRRARTLGLIEQQRCFNAMVAELYLGRLDEDNIEIWEPVRGSSPVLERVHEALRRLPDKANPGGQQHG